MKRAGAVVGMIALAAFLISGVFHLYQQFRGAETERAEKEKQLNALVDERTRLEQEIEFLKSQSALEREAKSRLNYKKEGEHVVVIVPNGELRSGAGTSSNATEPPRTFWGVIGAWIASLAP